MDEVEPSAGAGSSTISFGDVVIDLDRYEVYRAGESVAIEPQVFDVLCYLIEHRDQVVSKVELFDNVWGDRFVSESALTSRIKSARQAVGDDGRRQEIIRTSHGRGYRFVAEIIETPPEGRPAGAATATDEGELEAPTERQIEPAARQNNVPAPARPLVAREDEFAELTALLATNRLVTVVGPGGVGKTRLATEVAARWDQDFDGAVTFVALAPISSPDDVFGTISSALGVGGRGTVGAVREALAGKSALLVLDNFEHLLDAATTLADLVESVPGIRVLVTSRERLGLAEEQVLELDPFSLTPDGSSNSSAVTFFEHAVRGVGSAVDLDAADRDDAVGICAALDGLPLAIELAAAQTRYFSLSYLRSQLESTAMTIADQARDRPERHHTMESTIAWSYRLLTRSQQKLLASLSVYRGAWSLAAADAITGGNKRTASAHDLLKLVDKSLVQRSDGVRGEPRFSMLRLFRDFAGAQLDSSGTRDETLARHASSVLESVQSLEASRWGDSGDGWIEAINAEYADVVAALTWCFDRGDPSVGCQIVRRLGYWWYRSGRHGEGRVWVDHAIANISTTDDQTAGWIHAAAGNLALYELRPSESLPHFQKALTLAREVGDDRLEARSHLDIGATTAGAPGGYETGLATVQLGLDLARRIESPQLIAHGLTVVGEVTRANGDLARAEAAYREALDLNVEIGDPHYQAVNTLNMGHALMAQDRMPEALPYHRRGIELSTQLRSRLMMAWNLAGLARAHHLLGRPQLAAQLIGAGQTTLDALGATYGPVDQPIQDDRERELRTDLGEAEFNTLVGEGRELGLETSIGLALEALDQ